MRDRRTEYCMHKKFSHQVFFSKLLLLNSPSRTLTEPKYCRCSVRIPHCLHFLLFLFFLLSKGMFSQGPITTCFPDCRGSRDPGTPPIPPVTERVFSPADGLRSLNLSAESAVTSKAARSITPNAYVNTEPPLPSTATDGQ